jgi:hypothetical protein
MADALRLEWALLRYDIWLDWHEVRSSRRRALRRELRANLAESAGDGGAVPAIRGLGSIRRLAAETAAGLADDGRPRWLSGIAAAIAAFALCLVLIMSAALVYLSAVADAGTEEPVSGWLVPFPGADVTAEASERTFGVEVTSGWLPVAVALIVFVTVAKPWRLLGRR